MKQGKYVLENKMGQVVRTFDWQAPHVTLVYRQDTHRIEPHSDTKTLDDLGIAFQVLAEVSRSEVEKSPVSIGKLGQLRFLPRVDTTSPSVPLTEEKDEFKTILRWTAIAHLSVLALILIANLIVDYFFVKPETEQHVVTVFKQRPDKPTPKVTLAPSEHKIKKQKIAKVKPVNKRVTAKLKPKRYAQKTKQGRATHARRQLNINKVGALGVLGGMNPKARGAGGLNLNAVSNSRGSGVKGMAAAGGYERSLHGKGLIAGSPGSGEVAAGAGGYGTRGKGGGQQAGYGKMSLAGSSAAYSQPLDEEALIEGGLDREQIAAVINRHIGQIIYCYEQGLQVKPKLTGRVAVRFVIDGRGIVDTAGVANTSLRSAKVEGCIVSRLKSWKFPKPVGNVNVKVTYPFVLRRVSQG